MPVILLAVMISGAQTRAFGKPTKQPRAGTKLTLSTDLCAGVPGQPGLPGIRLAVVASVIHQGG